MPYQYVQLSKNGIELLGHPNSTIRKYKVVGLTGVEPVTLRLSSACSNQLSYRPITWLRKLPGGAEEIRTPDILLAKQTLYQLSYSPNGIMHVRRSEYLST